MSPTSEHRAPHDRQARFDGGTQIDEEFVRREIEVEACPQEVWEALVEESERDRWLGYDPDREVYVEAAEEPEWLVWQWSHGDEQSTRVEFVVLPTPAGSRVIVTETAPRFAEGSKTFPLETFASALALVAA